MKKRIFYILLGFVLLFVALKVVFIYYKPFLVLSDSVNFRIGILKNRFTKDDITTGSYVLFDYNWKLSPERIKIADFDVLPFVKRVACKEGHYLNVDLRRRLFFCDGIYIGTAKEYFLNGEKTRIFFYNGIIPEGYFFVMGDSKDSFDSRYFGFVSFNEIKGIVIPLF